MTQGGFSQTSAAEQHLMPPERARWPIWPWFLLLGGLVFVLLVYSFLPPAPPPNGEQHETVGKQITTFQLEPLTGDARTITEDDLKGKVTLINFWGPWCVACAIEFPHLVDLERHFQGNPNFQFISVSANANPLDDTGLEEGTSEFLKHFGAEFPTYRDPQAKTKDALALLVTKQTMGSPATVLIGPTGVIRALWIGYAPGDETAVRLAIEKTLVDLAKQR